MTTVGRDFAWDSLGCGGRVGEAVEVIDAAIFSYRIRGRNHVAPGVAIVGDAGYRLGRSECVRLDERRPGGSVVSVDEEHLSGRRSDDEDAPGVQRRAANGI